MEGKLNEIVQLDKAVSDETFVEGRNSTLEVNQSRYVVDAVLFGFRRIVDLDEDDALLVALVVDLLQFGGDSLRVGIFLVI